MPKLAPLLFAVSIAFTSLASFAQADRDAVVAALVAEDYGTLERSFAQTQQRFERGELDEYALQRAFEPFAAIRDPAVVRKLDAWVAQFPGSYVANLAVGLNDRAAGSAARGRQFWDRTPVENREAMIDHFKRAEPRLRHSIPLTASPYLSLLDLMTIAGNVGNRPFLNAALLLANESLPSNVLARLRYARYLLPRWGGSAEQFDAFVAMSRTEGVAESTLRKLQALALNDRGMVLLAAHDDAGADATFRQALQTWPASDDDGGLRAQVLAASIKRLCADAAACRAEPSRVAIAVAAPFVGGPYGDDVEHAIVVPTEDESEGVRTEYAWLALRYPGARRTRQSLIVRDSRHYDLLAVTTADGRDLQLYFDISAFFGDASKRKAATRVDEPPATRD